MTRFKILNRLLHRFGYELASADDQTPTGVDAVVTDYQERHSLSAQSKRITAHWKSVERIANEGHFNALTVANITFDLGTYGETVITLDLDDELPHFMEHLGHDVEDLQWLVGENHGIPMCRIEGDWEFDYARLDEHEIYNHPYEGLDVDSESEEE